MAHLQELNLETIYENYDHMTKKLYIAAGKSLNQTNVYNTKIEAYFPPHKWYNPSSQSAYPNETPQFVCT